MAGAVAARRAVAAARFRDQQDRSLSRGNREGARCSVARAALHLPNQRDLFGIPRGLAYFNCASLAPLLRSVRAAGEQALARRAQPWTIGPAEWFGETEELRALFARLIGADPEGIALIPATSYGLATAAQNIGAGGRDRVLVVADDFPSTVYTWRTWAKRHDGEVIAVERHPGQTWTDAILAALDERVRVVSVPNVHWTDGALVDLTRVGERTREAGALFVIDASQSLGVMPLDASELRPDFLVAAGYKWLLGPLSVAYLFVADRHREGQPLEQNWINRAGAEDFAGLTDYTDEYLPGARRFDVGQHTNFELTPMAIAALEQLLAWGVDNTAATLARWTGRIESDARERGLDPVPAAQRGPHMLGLSVPASIRATIGEQLANANVYVGMRGPAMRVSPHLHVEDADVERLFAALDRAMA
jgi:selenocysteine lyase/cysteine desulfurase